jgi:hypothetical protein
MDRVFFILGSLSGGLAVALGAFAAHGAAQPADVRPAGTLRDGRALSDVSRPGAAGGRQGGDALDARGVSELRRLALRRRHDPLQFFEQSLRFFQIRCVKAFGEPAVDFSQELTRL